MKTIDLSKSVYDLSRQYPEFVPIMSELGFKEITQPMKLESMGRFMTVDKGAQMHNIPLENIIKKFEERGYAVVGIKQ